MRLISLDFAGVGSFADHMTVDFEALGGAGLFLIEGPTGAGKSTILDAIVFALYGSPAGSEADPGRLDSHLRKGNSEPYVELDFGIGGATYRIRRTPRHERDKKRGTGMKVDEGGVSLIRLAPDPAGISSKAKEVGDWVIEHIGLSKQQFVSTIVLAQGEFSTFLNAETRDRTPILEKVFGTEFYQDVEQQLAQMRKVAIASRGEAADRVTEAVDRCLGLLSIDADSDQVAVIDAELVRLRSGVDQAQAHAAECGTALTAAEGRLSAAREFVAAQQTKRTLLERHEELDERASGVDALRAALTEHERARPVMAALEAWRDIHAEAQRAAVEFERQRARLSDLAEVEVTQQRLEEVTALRASLTHAAHLEEQLPALQADEARLQDEVRRAQSAVVDLTAERDRLLVQIAEDQRASQRPNGDAECLAALTVERAALEKQAATAQRVAADSRDFVAADHRVAEAQLALDALLAQLSAARRSQLANLAATLASRLVDGEACLVCGSVQHPQPAVAVSESEDPVAELEARSERAQAEVRRLSAVRERLGGQLKVLRADAPVDLAQALARLDDIAQEHTALQAAIEAADQAAARLRAAESRVAEVTERLTQLRIDAQQYSADLESALVAWGEAQTTVTAAAAGHPSVAARVQALTMALEALASTLEAERAFSRARSTAEHAEQTLRKTLAGLGFGDARAAEAAILDDVLAEQYRTQIDDYDADRVTVTTALQAMADVDLAVVTDVVALETDVSQRRGVHLAAQKELGRLEHTLVEAAPLRDQIRERAKAQERVHAETAGVIRMADLATATRGEGMHRVRLSAFVLMRRFESVVDAANDRLDAISDGRYQLKVEHHGLDNRGQHGLDLLVEDQRTERRRPTTSLSGGESFYVSLALALGLADVVRSESGGVSLGTLFIDEGFGSLDSEVLEEVIDMLEQVRAGEDRVIGLVSHVDLLKQRIDPRISVRRDPTRPGVSTLEVHV
jgi:exonuclease SbcC